MKKPTTAPKPSPMQRLLRYLFPARNRRRYSRIPLLGESLAAFNGPRTYRGPAT